MTTNPATNKGLNALQVSLLRLFNRPMTDEQAHDLQKILVKHYTAQLHEELERITEEKGYTQEDFDKMLNQES